MFVKTLLITLLLFTSRALSRDLDFNFDIKPILSDRCFVCHGPDEANREADLRFDLAEVVGKESESGNAPKIITPGSTKDSELWFRISASDPDVIMPPPDSKLALSKAEVEKLRDWIQQGAKYKQHWSFNPIAGRRNPSHAHESTVDHYVSQQLQERGWSFSQIAPKETLIRRLTFDLTGLPPTPQEVNEYVSTDSESAYENLIDRLLASTRYGERMASIWLDVARYSDTYGYQVDRERFVWPYRDWVIQAFNSNLPYDEFVTEQLAGDLLPNATEDQILATTFNRLHPQKVEGGSVPEEFRIEYVADRTQTFATSILGLTLECARCHDHKYDPISQKEYYQLTAFFDKIDEAGLYSYFTQSIPTPTLMLDKDGAKEKAAQLHREMIASEENLASLRQELTRTIAHADSRTATRSSNPIEILDFEDAKLNGNNKSIEGVVGNAVRLSGDDAVNLETGNFHRYEPFSISLWLRVPKRFERSVVFHRSRAWTDAGSRGYECLIKEGRLSASLIHFWPGNAISVQSEVEFPVNEWHQVTMTYDGSSRAAGLQLYLDGEQIPTNVVRDNLYKEITGGGNDHITIGERFRDVGLRNGDVDEFLIFDRELTGGESKRLFDAAHTPSASEQVATQVAHNDRYQEQLATVREARKAYCDATNSMQEIMVMQEATQPRQTYLLGRGAYDNKREKVVADTLAVLPAMDASLPRNRLGLAKWLTAPNHPLTSRVAVNRIWQMLFGEGLVRTPEDFGSQGQIPTHPQLLDALSRDFMDHGWNTKQLIKQIVMSKTYQQSSVASPQLLESDPENRFYARAPSYRWPAEMLRDQSLAASGLIVEKLGGPPVKPYDLQVSFKPMKPDEGEGLYRRSVYTYWKRTGPAPAMMALDAAKRDVCRVQRGRTSSPLQSLVLMNSPQFVEAARALAENVTAKHDETSERLDLLFQTLTSRHATAEEKAVLNELYQQQLGQFSARPEDAKAYLGVGKQTPKIDIDQAEFAALTTVANALFGLDECMMKR